MNERNSGGGGGIVLFIVIAIIVYKVGIPIYKHFHVLEVHSKTIVAAKIKNVGFEKTYDENGNLERNRITASLRMPMGPVNIERRWTAEETSPANGLIPLTDYHHVQFHASSAFSAHIEPLRYSRAYDETGALIGQDVGTDFFAYGRQYRLDGKLKSETLSAGLNMSAGPVDLQCRRVWTFTEPRSKNYGFPISNNWQKRIVSSGHFGINPVETFSPQVPKMLYRRSINHDGLKGQDSGNNFVHHAGFPSPEWEIVLRDWNKKKIQEFAK